MLVLSSEMGTVLLIAALKVCRLFALVRESFLVGLVSSGMATLFRFLGAVPGSFLALWDPSLCPVI
jgi:hypothetical protein